MKKTYHYNTFRGKKLSSYLFLLSLMFIFISFDMNESNLKKYLLLVIGISAQVYNIFHLRNLFLIKNKWFIEFNKNHVIANIGNEKISIPIDRVSNIDFENISPYPLSPYIEHAVIKVEGAPNIEFPLIDFDITRDEIISLVGSK